MHCFFKLGWRLAWSRKMRFPRTSVPNFPALKDFLAFWETKFEGPLFAVTVAHSKLIKPAELRAVDGVFRLH